MVDVVVDLLIKAHPAALKHQNDGNGDLPLHCYLYCGNANGKIVRKLLKADGVDPFTTTKYGT